MTDIVAVPVNEDTSIRTLQDAREVLGVAAALGPIEAIPGMTVWKAEHVSYHVNGQEQVSYLGVYATKAAAERAMRNWVTKIWGRHAPRTVSANTSVEPDYFRTASDDEVINRYLQETFAVQCRITEEVLSGQPGAVWIPKGDTWR